MTQSEKLLDLGLTMRKYLDALNQTRKNIETLGSEENLAKYDPISSTSTNYNTRLIKRDLRWAFNDLLTFNEPHAKAMPVFFATSCFTQDWDTLLTSLEDVPMKCLTDELNVTSWGHVYQNIDLNFIKQLRNAIAHSKFDYNFEEDKIYISAYKDTFKVDFPSKIILSTPKTILELKKYSTSKHAWVDCFFILDEKNIKYLHTFFLRNGDHAHPVFMERFPTSNLSEIPLTHRAQVYNQFVQKVITEKSKSANQTLRRLKNIAEQCGLELESKGKVSVAQQTFKGNKFLELMAKVIYQNDEEGFKNLCLRGASMRPEKEFISNPFFHTLVVCSPNDPNSSMAKNVANLTQNHAPYYLQEMHDYAERAYLNYVFNYLTTKVETSEGFKTGQSIIPNLTNQELTSHLRNSIVHPNRLQKKDNYYIITDYNRKNELTFNEIIPVEALINYADNIVSIMKSEQANKDDSSKELI